MATVNKDFKIKNGLIVEGANGTINGYDILTKDSADQAYIVGLIGGSANSQAVANTVVIRDAFANFAANTITANLIGTVSSLSNHDTDDLAEGATNKYFSNTLARNAFVGGTGLDYNSTNGTFDIDSTVTTNSGSQTLTNKTISGADNTLSNIANASLANSSVTINGFSISLGGSATYSTDNIGEGTTNFYFSNARVRDAVSAGEGLNYNESTGEFTAHLGYGLEISNNAIRVDADVIATDLDVAGAISAHDVSSNVHGVTGNVVGTTDAQTISNKTLGSNLDANNYTVTNLPLPSNSTDAASKAYVDGVSEGLHIHASAVAATTTNIALSGYGGAFPLMVDGVTVSDQQRVLVKNQNTASQNGIYVYNSASGTLTRAADFDAPAEVDGGDFIFVSGGTTQADTGWVQTSELVATIGTDPIYFTQFSGAGTFLAGYGLYLDGNTFNANANVLATISYVDSEVDTHTGYVSNVHGVTGNVVGTSDTQTLSNKTLGNNIVLGADLDAVNSFTVKNLEEPSNNQDAATKFYVDNAISGVSNTIAGLDTDDVAEGANNLYFTNARADARVLSLLTNSTQTNISITEIGGALVVSAENGVADSDTDDLVEGANNLYFTNTRAQAAMVTPLTTGTQTNISVTYDALTGTYSFAAENGVADSDTDDLTEGTNNLYFTNARAVAALEAVTPNFTEIDINSVATQVAATTGNVATASQVTAFSWPKASYRSAEFLVKTAYSTHTEVSKVILTMDTSDNIAITEYAIVGTNGSAATITADVSGSDARLRVTTLNNNSTVTVVGTLLV
jgi:hypothetical protein